MNGHDRHYHHIGVGQDLGGLVGFELYRGQRGGDRAQRVGDEPDVAEQPAESEEAVAV